MFEDEAEEVMSDFHTLVKHKPLAMLIWTDIVDVAWLQNGFAGAKEVGSARWCSHWGAFSKVNDANVVKQLMRQPVNGSASQRKLRDVVNALIKKGARVRLTGHSGDVAAIQSIVALQVQNGFLNLLMHCQLRSLCTSDVANKKAKSLRCFLSLPPGAR